ncbi:MAG: AAA family ATPase [Clostridia bacterium]|nr:AAA family ATPase [Clostridia bacterium]
MHKLLHIQQEICSRIFEREELVEGLTLGALTGQHVLLVGPPGTGKSMVAHEFCRRLAGGRYFSYLMTRYTRPEEIIGNVSLKGLERDEFLRVLTGKTADAHFVFLDEVFLANSSCANALLTIMNERVIHNGTFVQPVPLLFLVGACNRLSVGEGEWQAFVDRFLLRFEVGYLEDTGSLARLLSNPGSTFREEGTSFSLAELECWQKEVQEVQLPQVIVGKLINLLCRLRNQGMVISDRRFRETGNLLRAKAYLAGRDGVEVEDLQVVVHAWWQRPEERLMVVEALQVINLPYEVKARELLTRAKAIAHKVEVMDNRARLKAVANDSNYKLTEIYEELTAMHKALNHQDPWLGEATKQVDQLRVAVISKCLGLNQAELH